MGQVYEPDDWPHGLRCADCHREFVEGQPISEVLTAMTEYEGQPAPMCVLKCWDCAISGGTE